MLHRFKGLYMCVYMTLQVSLLYCSFLAGFIAHPISSAVAKDALNGSRSPGLLHCLFVLYIIYECVFFSIDDPDLGVVLLFLVTCCDL